MIIRFQIVKSAVIEAVKNATYMKARIDSAADEKATKMSLQETAGTEDVHDRTLTHDFRTALEVVKTILVDYIVPTAQTIGDNVIFYNEKDDDVVDFTLDVSRRYNGTLTDTLARMTAKYVEDYMMYQWWLKTSNQKQAEPYQAFLVFDEQNIRRCFVLSGPKVPTVPYTQSLTAKVDGSESDGGVTVALDDEDVTLSYTIDAGAIDDIEARSSDPEIMEVHRDRDPHSFRLKARNTGVVTITLFSRHSDKIETEVEITIAKEV